MDLALEDMNGSKSRMADKAQRTLEVNGDVKIGSDLLVNAYGDIQAKSGKKGIRISLKQPDQVKSHKNLRSKMETIDNKPMSITTGNFNNYD